MRNAFIVLVGATSLTLIGCGAEAGSNEGDAPEGAPGAEEVGVSTSELTNCTRTELVNADMVFWGEDFLCRYRLMENNFECDEGIVGQASTEITYGRGDTSTTVWTKLFGQNYAGSNGWASPATIATQWGHTFASRHAVLCKGDSGRDYGTNWTLDPFSKKPIPGK